MSVEIRKFLYRLSRRKCYRCMYLFASPHYYGRRQHIEFPANKPTKAESLPYSLEQVAGDINLHVNANITESMCFNPPTPPQKKKYLHPKWWFSETSKKVHLPQNPVSSTENNCGYWRDGLLSIGHRPHRSQTYPIK